MKEHKSNTYSRRYTETVDSFPGVIRKTGSGDFVANLDIEFCPEVIFSCPVVADLNMEFIPDVTFSCPVEADLDREFIPDVTFNYPILADLDREFCPDVTFAVDLA